MYIFLLSYILVYCIIRERKGSKWISKILRKRASSLDSAANKPVRKPHRRGSDPTEWNIPTPPPLPKVKYLMGKYKHSKSHSFKKEAEKEVMVSNWGREAYDDNEEESDEGSVSGSVENLSQMKLKQKQLVHVQRPTVHHSRASETTESSQPKKIMQRRDTPRPKMIPNATPQQSSNLKSIPLNLNDGDSNQMKPKRLMQQQQQTKQQAAAPIAKVASARLKNNKPLLQNPPRVQAQTKPLSLSDSQRSTFREDMPTQTQQTKNIISAPSAIIRQSSIDEGELIKEKEEDDDDDDDQSSSEEDSSEYESTDSSDTDDDDDDDDRPIMAQNMGIHGAKIAKQVMQRMKNQRYPSIFSKPVIKLDTITDVRYETPYQLVND